MPTTDVVIYDANFKLIDKVAGPFEEDSSATLICDADKGNVGIVRYTSMSGHFVCNAQEIPLRPCIGGKGLL